MQLQARHRRIDALAAVLALAVALASGCGKDRPRNPEVAGGAGEPVGGGTAVVALAADPDVLNPLLSNATIAGVINAELYDGLADMAEDLTYRPRLARGWDVAPDGLSITYHLKPWSWSDGAALTARDVVMSLGLFKDERTGSTRRSLYDNVVGAEAVDDSTVRYTLARVVPDPVQATWHQVLPWHILQGLDPSTAGTWPINQSPLSSGAFRLESWAHNRDLTFVRNPAYPGTPARLDRVVFRVLPDESVRLLALETGEVDVADGISSSAAKRLEARGDLRLVDCGGRLLYYLMWNCVDPVFADAATRRALSLAVDRERLVSSLVDGFGTPAASPIAPALWNHDRDLRPDACDVEAARRLLAGAGWRDEDGDGVLERAGRELRFEILTKGGDPVREQGGVILRENLAAVGAAVEVRAMEQVAGLARVRAGDFDAYLGLFTLNLYGNPAPSVRSTATGEFNFGHYANTTVDSLLDVALGERDRARALPTWKALQSTLAADPPAAYLFYPDNLVAVNRRLRDVRPHMLSPVNNLDEWWIAPADRRAGQGGR